MRRCATSTCSGGDRSACLRMRAAGRQGGGYRRLHWCARVRAGGTGPGHRTAADGLSRRRRLRTDLQRSRAADPMGGPGKWRMPAVRQTRKTTGGEGTLLSVAEQRQRFCPAPLPFCRLALPGQPRLTIGSTHPSPSPVIARLLNHRASIVNCGCVEWDDATSSQGLPAPPARRLLFAIYGLNSSHRRPARTPRPCQDGSIVIAGVASWTARAVALP